MSKQTVNAYYDSDEGIAWGPYTAKEMKGDLQRPRPKPKHRRTVFKITCKDPSTSSSNDTMFSAVSEFEKENSSRICNIDDKNSKAEGSSMATYYTADETYMIDSKGANDDSVITVSSDEEEVGYQECMFNTYGNMHTPIQIKEEDRKSDQGVITILDNSTDENLSNHMPGRLEEKMTEIALSEKTNDSAMVETTFYLDSQKKKSRANRSEQSFNDIFICDYSSDEQVVPGICSEDDGTKVNQHSILQRSQSEQAAIIPRGSGSKTHERKNNESGKRSHLSTESHLNNNGPHLSKLNNSSNDDNKYSLMTTGNRSLDYNDIPGSEICDQPKLDQMVNAEHRLNASLNESDTSISDSIHLNLSTDASSFFDASCFYGNEPCDAELETTTDEDEPAEPKHNLPLTVPATPTSLTPAKPTTLTPAKPTTLTPAKCLAQKGKVTPYKTTPQVFKVPEVMSAKKTKAPDKFKDVISPVRLYIQHSPMAHLKQNVVPHPAKSPFISAKTSPSVSKTDTLDNCDMLPPILYKPPGKNIVTTKSKQWFMPPSLGKHVKDPLVVKHEKKLNAKEVSRLSEKLGLDESSFGSEADMSTDSANMSVLCIKKNFN